MNLSEFRNWHYNRPAYEWPDNHLGFPWHDGRPNHSDISSHIPFLQYLASKCNHIVEFGVRDGGSTSAFMCGLPSSGKLMSYDLNEPPFISELDISTVPCDWKFNIANTTDENFEIEETDLLFIDTLHTYEQVRDELALHAHKARKQIVFHDTQSHGEISRDVNGAEGILKSIYEFLDSNKEWHIAYKVEFCQGLTLIEKSSG